MNKTDREAWLIDMIEVLENKALFTELTEREKKSLDKYVSELKDILDSEVVKEEQLKQEKSQEMKQRRWRGKYGEQRLAKKVGGKVVGRSKYIVTEKGKGIAINCQKPPDVITDMFSFESKWLAHVPASIRKVMTQATTNCPEGLTPIGVIGDRENKIVYYIMTEADWIDLHGGDE